MMLYVVIYDVSDDKRRKRVFNLLEGYGRRVQFSAFECLLNDRKFEELRVRLAKVVKMSDDSVRFYPISRHTLGQVVIWGEPPLSQPPSSVIV
ncbi:MAG: CRISPR-associated endonuclease Cas2 [Pseudanabaena sp.]|jgi:CRISPR-associated protein Cas2|uniref:CRISPR-associated endonuclease Cas2 n=1 Tax=Pseudanabaena mucicola TaxID=71190 RepID=UPI003306AA0D|nr:CRISPR-associated endonuclease Cas2 [Pseudanabaena sp. M53BS1SP1A06MG]MCA6580558.1 CRISPR-associated endonuclease Cas2 [Pseudanabaena sp. M34BS1SP1A06MG]MCA6585169.1 CRISPR-associated endonuclease Cas2 [Pseudanabaena sp. M051S1SP1A06QC]MCA6588946.1 CRISPR-associated endonuclease Cas2 [Pseudanabaena sp. M109S1SP1A06QC]MCA6592706.1 CRISPR-associated endonuclease Cas2 [Pseudanabaena sp. M38BS1SP1A06MG]MCA6596644.1 CRISPR-associated endonuclease Cas2 [Pseudanabaena sp. M046S1SP1A06QC]MCA660191